MAHASTQHDVTALLHQWHAGDAAALESLVPLVYEELRRLAHAQMRRERPDHTLNTTALVHEAYLNLAGDAPDLNSRSHFFGVAARVMRRVLIWNARRKMADKRGGGQRPEPLGPDAEAASVEEDIATMLEVDTALTELEATEPRWCRVVECRYFTGLTIAESAEALGISPATVKRDWESARAWLEARLTP